MARRKRKSAEDQDSRRRVPADEKIARLLALLLVKEIKKDVDKVPLLRSAGFDVSELAGMLGMTESHIRVADHRGRKKAKAG